MSHPVVVHVARAAAFLIGLAVLLAATLFSAGLVLMAPLGAWLAHRFQRARQRVTTGWASWLGAVCATTFAGLLLAGVVASRESPATWHRMRSVADSASAAAAQEPPPRWIARLAPAAGGASMSVHPTPDAVLGPAIVWAAAMGVAMLSTILASVGWVGILLLTYAVSGRWLPRHPEPLSQTPSDER